MKFFLILKPIVVVFLMIVPAMREACRLDYSSTQKVKIRQDGFESFNTKLEFLDNDVNESKLSIEIIDGGVYTKEHMKFSTKIGTNKIFKDEKVFCEFDMVTYEFSLSGDKYDVDECKSKDGSLSFSKYYNKQTISFIDSKKNTVKKEIPFELRANYKIIDIVNNDDLIKKSKISKNKGMKKLPVKFYYNVNNKMASEDKIDDFDTYDIGLGVLRKRANRLLKKYPELKSFIVGYKDCLENFDINDPCSKIYILGNELYNYDKAFVYAETKTGEKVKFNHGNDVKKFGQWWFKENVNKYNIKIRKNKLYEQVLDTIKKAAKDPVAYLRFNGRGNVFIGDNPEKTNIHLCRVNGNWRVRMIYDVMEIPDCYAAEYYEGTRDSLGISDTICDEFF